MNNRKNTAQIYLEQVRGLDTRVKNKLIEQQQWKDIALSITANMEGERVQSSGSKSKLENAMVKCVDMEAEIDSLIDQLIDTKKEVIQTIEQVNNPTWYELLHKKYIQHKRLDDIADDFGKTYDWAKVNHCRALRVIDKILSARND